MDVKDFILALYDAMLKMSRTTFKLFFDTPNKK